MGDAVEQAIAELHIHTLCACDEAWTSRRLHETGCASFWREDVDTLAAEIERLRAALAYEISRRTVGGRPPAVDEQWANQALPPPDSASDESMPAHRRVGMARSDDAKKPPPSPK